MYIILVINEDLIKFVVVLKEVVRVDNTQVVRDRTQVVRDPSGTRS